MASCFRITLVLLAFCMCTRAKFYVIDDLVGLGRRFDGIGGLSGGGVKFLCVNVFKPVAMHVSNLTSVISSLHRLRLDF